MIIFYNPSASINHIVLIGQEAKHCTRVLRKKEGDDIYITDGKGKLYHGVIESITKKDVVLTSISLLEDKYKPIKTAIAISPTKNNSRLEWFLEKSVEIGISDIYPIITERTERPRIKKERLEGILISAMKQSKNFHLPRLHELMQYEEFINGDHGYDDCYIAHCMKKENYLLHQYQGIGSAMVMIGPEGDFTQEEVDKALAAGYKETNLGDSRLRTETAGVVACHLMQVAKMINR